MKSLICILLSYIIILSVEARGGRGGGRGGRGGGWLWGRGSWFSSGRSGGSRSSSSSTPSTKVVSSWSPPKTKSFSDLKPIIERVSKTRTQTRYGTEFKQETTKLMTKRIANKKKLFGLGVGAAFIGGAGFGFGPGLASYSIYHRYHYLQELLQAKGYNEEPRDEDYYSKYYENNACLVQCPSNTHCEWGFCERNAGFTKSWGQCSKSSLNFSPSRENLEVSALVCAGHDVCQEVDINMVCVGITCTCRKDMKWNSKALECQILLDVDCSAITYDSRVARRVQATVEYCTKYGDTDCERAEFEREKLKQRDDLYEEAFGPPPARCEGSTDFACGTRNRIKKMDELKSLQSKYFVKKKIPEDRTETKEESLSGSLLKYMDHSPFTRNASKADLTEAFCRDIESFNEVFQMDDSVRPAGCKDVPDTVCAALYDSGTCGGGWVLQVDPGTQRRLAFFSSDWKYRNDVDVIGLKNGCTFTGFSGSSFDGNKMTFTAGVKDRWLVLETSSSYSDFHEDIESFQCVCRG